MPSAQAPSSTASSASARLVMPQIFTLVGWLSICPNRSESPAAHTSPRAGAAGARSAFGRVRVGHRVRSLPQRRLNRLLGVVPAAGPAQQADRDRVTGLVVLDRRGEFFGAVDRFAVDAD